MMTQFVLVRFDLRPFLYRVSWPWQFSRIDRALHTVTSRLSQTTEGTLEAKHNSTDRGTSSSSATTSASNAGLSEALRFMSNE